MSLWLENKGALVTIVTAFLIHVLFTFDVPNFIITNGYNLILTTASNVSIGVSLLLFPLYGLLADVYLTRYRMLQYSLLKLVFTLIVFLILVVAEIFMFPFKPIMDYLVLSDGILLGLGITSIGIFAANAIQFGMDQLLEASSTQLSAFIHCYF